MEYTQEQIDAAAAAGISVEEYVAQQATPSSEEAAPAEEAPATDAPAPEEVVA